MNHEDTKDTKVLADRTSHQVIGAALEVHRAVGPGLLESAYLECLCCELELRGVGFARQVSVPLTYRGRILGCGYRIDLLVEACVVVELKAVEEVHPVAVAQMLTYLRLTGLWLGLLINFHTPVLRQGIRRIVNGW